MIDWTIVLAVIGTLFAGTALLIIYVPVRKPSRQVAELEGRIQGFETYVEALKREAAVWKERGDKYASHNNNLQEQLYKIHAAIADILKQPERLASYKEMLNALKPEVKK